MLTETLYIAELFPVMFLLNSSPEINLVVFPFLQNACARDQFRFYAKEKNRSWEHYKQFPLSKQETWTVGRLYAHGGMDHGSYEQNEI